MESLYISRTRGFYQDSEESEPGGMEQSIMGERTAGYHILAGAARRRITPRAGGIETATETVHMFFDQFAFIARQRLIDRSNRSVGNHVPNGKLSL
jgi:hypothetical protein